MAVQVQRVGQTESWKTCGISKLLFSPNQELNIHCLLRPTTQSGTHERPQSRAVELGSGRNAAASSVSINSPNIDELDISKRGYISR